QAVARFAEDIVLVDHRKLGWGEWHGADAVRENIRSALREWPVVRADIDEVLACDDRVVVFLGAFRGTAEGGGTYEIPIGGVFLREQGLTPGVDQYEADDRHTMIGRYGDLGGGQGALGDRPVERVMREIIRRFDRGDIARMFENLWAE